MGVPGRLLPASPGARLGTRWAGPLPGPDLPRLPPLFRQRPGHVGPRTTRPSRSPAEACAGEQPLGSWPRPASPPPLGCPRRGGRLRRDWPQGATSLEISNAIFCFFT